MLLHATCLAIGGKGVLLTGPPGSGKSGLALRLIDQPGTGVNGTLKTAILVADDQVRIRSEGGRLIAAAPANLAGKLEVRGLGIVTAATSREVDLALVVRLERAGDIERVPNDEGLELIGIALPQVSIDATSPSAAARVRAALDWLESR